MKSDHCLNVDANYLNDIRDSEDAREDWWFHFAASETIPLPRDNLPPLYASTTCQQCYDFKK